MIAAARALLGRMARVIESPVPVVSAAGLEHMPPGGDIYRRLADELDTYLVDDFLSHWFPRCIDTRGGGFHQDFSENWRPNRASERLVVHQARQTWVCARVALHDPELAERFAGYALHGLEYLAGPMWDEELGGPYFLLTADGRPLRVRESRDRSSIISVRQSETLRVIALRAATAASARPP